MLSSVADEQHPILRLEACQEGVHLLGAGETRFIEHVQAAPSLGGGRRLDQVPLQRGRRHPGFRELVRRPTRRREPLHDVPVALRRVAHRGQRGGLPRARNPFEGLDAVTVAKDLGRGRALIGRQLGVVTRDRRLRRGMNQRRLRLLTLTHQRDRALLQRDHGRRGVGAPRSTGGLFDFDEFTATNLLLKFRLNLRHGRTAHRARQRIAQVVAFMRDRIALEIAIARVEHGVPTRGAG